MVGEVGALFEVGRVLQSVQSKLRLSYYIDSADPLPPEISNFIVGSLRAGIPQDFFKTVRIAIFFDGSSPEHLLRVATDAGAFVIVDETVAQKNRWLTPNTYAVVHTVDDLMASISNYLTCSMYDLFLGVDLAGRGCIKTAIEKCEEIKQTFPNIDGLRTFHVMQQERLKGSV